MIYVGAAAFIAAAALHLPPSDVWCILYPSLRHFLKSDVAEINELSLLVAMKPPVCNRASTFSFLKSCQQLPRQILDASVQWAMKADKTSFWRGPRRTSTVKPESPRESVISVRKAGGTIARNKSEE